MISWQSTFNEEVNSLVQVDLWLVDQTSPTPYSSVPIVPCATMHQPSTANH